MFHATTHIMAMNSDLREIDAFFSQGIFEEPVKGDVYLTVGR